MTLLKLDSLVQVACFSFFFFFFLFGCPTYFVAFEQLITRCLACFRAFEQFTTLIYIYIYICVCVCVCVCVLISLVFMLLVSTFYLLFIFPQGLREIFMLFVVHRPLGTQKNICAFRRPLGSIRLSFWQEDFRDLEKYLCFSSSIGYLEKYLPNYEFCCFLLVDDLPSSLGSICNLVVFCWDDLHHFKESYHLFLGQCTSF